MSHRGVHMRRDSVDPCSWSVDPCSYFGVRASARPTSAPATASLARRPASAMGCMGPTLAEGVLVCTIGPGALLDPVHYWTAPPSTTNETIVVFVLS